jgi:hypothetical protein
MAGDKESAGGAGMPFNLNTVLVLVTVAASVFLVSQRLSSDRPVAAAGRPMETIGDQTIEARLWEDPFSVWEKLGEEGFQALATNGLPDLRAQILAHRGTNGPAMLLPVMLDSGSYSEDRESRIRSHFAIVSALGQAGYAPEDAEHIGALRRPWPSASALTANRTNASSLATLTNSPGTLTLSYEWYRQRTFYPRAQPGHEQPILVLWLNSDLFEDRPLLRLALLLRDWVSTPGTSADGLATNVALIGPRRSSTLRGMLSGEFAGEAPLAGLSTSTQKEVSRVLQQITLFTATASAMDEVLVNADAYLRPRREVESRLAPAIFRAVRNFTATDGQLAGEILDELSLRQIDLKKPSRHHLVLISEWDSFFGRMLSLTYAAELAAWQGPLTNRSLFIKRFRDGELVWPANLHSYVYLRGLDGQTAAPDAEAGKQPQEPLRSQQARPTSFEDLARWSPDANKAEGRAQFDYLSRLGERISHLGQEIWLRDHGTIGAIGIVGSDVYDALLILQALRPRFPDAVFFTTGLDVRFWHPTEWQWSRNLVVASGYGLQLTRDLQQQIPPFRDSVQTALFAATLAALGNSNLAAEVEIRPRRFEIGRSGPIDLSTGEAGVLHPSSLRHSGLSRPVLNIVLPLVGSLAFGAILATLVWRPWRRLTSEAGPFQAECLWLHEEDLGGLEGYRIAVKELQESRDPLAEWLNKQLQANEPVTRVSATAAHSAAALIVASQDTLLLRTEEDRMQEFLDFLNDCLGKSQWVPPTIMERSGLVDQLTAKRYAQRAQPANASGSTFNASPLPLVIENRRIADEILNRLLETSPAVQGESGYDHAFTVTHAAASARKAGWETYRERHLRQRGFWTSAAICAGLILALLICSLRDTFYSRGGEPFSLVSGASAWPAEWLRLAAAIVAVCFVAESYAALRTGVLDITRRYRLAFTEKRCPCEWTLPTAPVPLAAISANRAWTRYQQMGRWSNRVCRIMPMLGAYVLLGFCLMTFSPWPHAPVRGLMAAGWDKGLIALSSLAFVFLNFWTMDAARLCRWFIEQLTEAPTRYPKAARDYFSRVRGGAPKYVLNEWLDLRIIAELTARVGGMIYFPFIVLFLLLLARNNWWDRWAWPAPLVVIFGLNMVFAVSSVVILQRAARRARTTGLERLEAKLNKLKAESATTETEKKSNLVAQAEKLVDEIHTLKTGAFAPFWENPIIGALLLPSGGSAVMALLPYLIGR